MYCDAVTCHVRHRPMCSAVLDGCRSFEYFASEGGRGLSTSAAVTCISQPWYMLIRSLCQICAWPGALGGCGITGRYLSRLGERLFLLFIFRVISRFDFVDGVMHRGISNPPWLDRRASGIRAQRTASLLQKLHVACLAQFCALKLACCARRWHNIGGRQSGIPGDREWGPPGHSPTGSRSGPPVGGSHQGQQRSRPPAGLCSPFVQAGRACKAGCGRAGSRPECVEAARSC